MRQIRSHGAVQPGYRWGPFTLRVPLVHVGVEIPELVQGLLVAGATGLSIVPLYMEWWGMSFETAVAMCIVSSVIVCAGPIVFGDPYCAGWLTPALPLVLRQAMVYESVPERTAFVTAVVLLVAATFLLMGVSGLGDWFLRAVPTESRIIYCQSRQREDCFQKAVIKRGLRRIRRSALRARSSSSQ